MHTKKNRTHIFYVLLFIFTNKKLKMKALVISGGGSKGAFAGGVAQYLIEELKRDYQLYIGTSTGSLLASHLALQKIEKIKNVYTNVTNNSIFNVCPFVVKQNTATKTLL